MKIDHASLSPISGPLTAFAIPAPSALPRTKKARQARALRLAAGLQRLEALHGEMLHRLIELADASEPDADFEPSLCGVSAAMPLYRVPRRLSGKDLEDQCDDEGAETDREPSLCGLGDVNPGHDGLNTFSFASDSDLENDTADSEPSLCGLTADTPAEPLITLPSGEIIHNTCDLEGQCDDEGHDSDREPEREF